MRKLMTFVLLVFLSLLAFAQQKPEPFGLKLGISTKEETMNVIAKEGGRVINSGYRVIKGDVVNPNVEGVVVRRLPVDNLVSATFWFFKGKLYKIEYLFPLSMEKEEFYMVYEQLNEEVWQSQKVCKTSSCRRCSRVELWGCKNELNSCLGI
jgi:thioredoxin-related protein